MTCTKILSYVRLSCHDSHLFACYLLRLLSVAAKLDQEGRQSVSEVARLVWQNYFPLEQIEYEEMAAQYARLFQLIDGPAGCKPGCCYVLLCSPSGVQAGVRM
jgi:hypothetical protein